MNLNEVFNEKLYIENEHDKALKLAVKNMKNVIMSKDYKINILENEVKRLKEIEILYTNIKK